MAHHGGSLAAPERRLGGPDWAHPELALGLAGVGGGLAVGAGAAYGPAAGLGALLLCIATAAVLARPWIGLLCLAAVVPALSGLQRGLPLPGLRLSEAIGAGVATLVLLRLDAASSPPWRAFDWAALAYAAGTVLLGAGDMLSRGDQFTLTTIGTLFGPFQFLLIYRAALAVLHSEDRRALALRALLLVSVAVSLLTLAQRAGVPGIDDMLTRLTGVDAQQAAREEQLAFGRFESTLRSTGPFPHWQVLAGYLFVIAVLAIALLLERTRRVLPAPWLLAICGLAVAGMIASGTFTTTLGLVPAALLLGFWARRLGRVAFTLGVGGMVLLTLFWSTVSPRIDQQFRGAGSGDIIPQSIHYRIDLWQDQLLPLLTGRWLTGYGPALPPGLSFPYTESVYLTLLLRGGVVLLVLYALLMVALGARAARNLDDPDPLARTMGRTMLVLVIALVPFHLLEPYFLTTGLPHLLWLLAAVLMAGGAARREAPT